MIVATAGHIDHGKTLLIRSLTNKDTDTLPEEKKRGMSIDLGFAYSDLGDGEITGFVDVPGHEKFVHTMVAGVGCVDSAVLVVALDDGLMPQTFEHIKILELLGIDEIIIVFTKLDKVSHCRAEAVKKEFYSVFADTFLAGAQSVFVSNLTWAGLQELKSLLIKMKEVKKNRIIQGNFRMALDRKFILPGVGKIVTGSIFSGRISLGDSVIHLPSRIEIKIKDLRIQDTRSNQAKVGDRCALNISGVDLGKTSLSRGDWLVSPNIKNLSQSVIAEVPIDIFKRKTNNIPIHFHLGAQHVAGKISQISSEKTDGGLAFARLYFQKNIHAVRGDQFIIRDQSARHTIGGGRIVDPLPHLDEIDKKRRKRFYFNSVKPKNLFLRLLSENQTGIDTKIFKKKFNLSQPEFKIFYEGEAVVFISLANTELILSRENYKKICKVVVTSLEQLHLNNPEKPDYHFGELVHVTNKFLGFDKNLFLTRILKDLVELKTMKIQKNRYSLKSFKAKVASEEQNQVDQISKCFGPESNQIYTIQQLSDKLDIGCEVIHAVLKEKIKQGSLVQISVKRYCSIELIEKIKTKCVSLVEQSINDSFSVADFKKITCLGRNQAIELLEYLDRSRVTLRVKNYRVLRKNRG